jgi:prepilin-type N-terminal cleavage/methylation domain-containing protein
MSRGARRIKIKMRPWSRILKRKNKCQSGAKSGFTFIETLIAAAIFGIIAAAIASSFVSGIKLWNRAQDTGLSKTGLFFDMEKICRDLRQAINVEKIGFEGSAEEVSFPAVINDSLAKVTYKFDPRQNQLVRSQIGLEGALLGKAPPAADSERPVLSPLEAFSISYFKNEDGSSGWTDAWTKDKGAFQAVRFQGRFKGEDFVKTIFIPAS